MWNSEVADLRRLFSGLECTAHWINELGEVIWPLSISAFSSANWGWFHSGPPGRQTGFRGSGLPSLQRPAWQVEEEVVWGRSCDTFGPMRCEDRFAEASGNIFPCSSYKISRSNTLSLELLFWARLRIPAASLLSGDEVAGQRNTGPRESLGNGVGPLMESTSTLLVGKSSWKIKVTFPVLIKPVWLEFIVMCNSRNPSYLTGKKM